MSSDLGNMLRMMNILGDDGFVDALQNAEKLVDDAEDTLERVERIEGEAEQAVREANQTLLAVDNRLAKFDETISLLEAKIEAGFSIGFFFFALNRYLDGEFLLAGALAFMGLLGASSLMITVATMPQIRRIRKVGMRAWSSRSERDEPTVEELKESRQEKPLRDDRKPAPGPERDAGTETNRTEGRNK